MGKPILRYDPDGPSGNIFFILAKAATIFDRQHRRAEFGQMMEQVRTCGSYDMALQILSQHFELREVKGI